MRERLGASLLAAGLLAGCQTAGGDGVLGSAVEGAGTDGAAQEGRQVAAAPPAQNPNARTRLRNTRNDLSDYCPAVRIRTGTETFRDVPKGGDKSDPAQVRYQATITGASRECSYVDQDLRMRVGVEMRAITGPRGQAGDFTVPIRVAVTVAGRPVYSKLHRRPVSIAGGQTFAFQQFVDEEVTLPAPTARNVRVFIGFDEGPYNTP